MVIPDSGNDSRLDDVRWMAFPLLVEQQVDWPFPNVLTKFASLLYSKSFSVASNGTCLYSFNWMLSAFPLFRRASKTTLG